MGIWLGFGPTWSLSVTGKVAVMPLNSKVSILTINSTSWSIGSPPHCVTDGFDLLSDFDDLSKFLSPSIFWIQEFDRAFIRANTKLTGWAYSESLISTCEAFRDLIKYFDDEILQMSRKTIGNANSQHSEPVGLSHFATPLPLIITAFRIYINAFHFLASDITFHVPQLIELYYLVCHWTQNAFDADEASSWAFYSSESYFRHMILVATIILRISRSPLLKEKVNLSKGEDAYRTVIHMLRRRSLSKEDSNARMADNLSELWRSNDWFKLPDGSHNSLFVQKSGHGVFIHGNKHP